MTRRIRLRPFQQDVDEQHQPRDRISGRIERGSFVLNALGADVRLPTSMVGIDGYGSFAIVETTRRQLAPGYVVEVDAEPDDDLFEFSPSGVVRVIGDDGESLSCWFTPSGSPEGPPIASPSAYPPKRVRLYRGRLATTSTTPSRSTHDPRHSSSTARAANC